VVELDALGIVYSQTRFDQIVNVSIENVEFENIAFRVEATIENVEVLLERYVAVDHIEKEHAERPHGSAIAVVLLRANPLGWRVDARAVEVVQFLLMLARRIDERARAKIDEFHLIRAQVNEDILVLDVTMEHAELVDAQDDVDDLLEVFAREILVEANAILERVVRDIVEEVFAILVTLHYDYEAMLLLNVVKNFYTIFNVSHLFNIDFN
jgi:hypothetical protein